MRHTSFDDLVANSDVLTFHCDLNDTSQSMLSMDSLPSSDHPVRTMSLPLAIDFAALEDSTLLTGVCSPRVLCRNR